MAARQGGAGGGGDGAGMPGAGAEMTRAPGALASGEASLIINQEEEAQRQHRDPQRLDTASRLPRLLQPPHRLPGQGRPRRTRTATSTHVHLVRAAGSREGLRRVLL